MEARFIERLEAYLIDSLIVSIILLLVCQGLPNNEEHARKQLQSLNNEYQNEEILEEEYLENAIEIIYNFQKNDIIHNSVVLIITFAYYIIFQYMNNGQTIGKKITKIQVVDTKSNKPPTLLKGFIRTVFIYNIFSSFTGIITIYTLNKNLHFTIYEITTITETIFIILSIVSIIKKGNGLHDILTKTQVKKVL